MKNVFYTIATLLLAVSMLTADPQPGDVFREYTWWKTDGDAGGGLRVGGKTGTTNWNTKIVDGHWETVWIDPGHDMDLQHAVKAEVNVEKILCHDGTFGLALQVNDSDWILVPEAEHIPEPKHQYQHHIYPNVEIPMDVLKAGTGNRFKMRVNEKQSWNWPQNIIYGVHFRIYYDAEKKPHPTGNLAGIQDGQQLDKVVNLEVKAASPNGDIERVDFIGLYEGINWEGDGVYRQWHYHFFHGNIMHHIGSDTRAPFRKSWQTDWIPDQTKPMQISARVQDEQGIIAFIEPVRDLTLDRSQFSVELSKPYRVPQKWVTRSGIKTQRNRVEGDLNQAVAYQLCWASWSPGYMNGLYVNDIKVFDSEGPNYKYYSHRVTIHDPSTLIAGQNEIKTGKTPLYNGKMVHGMEVEWPGIMLLIKYDKTIETSANSPKATSQNQVLLENYPNPFNATTTIHFELSQYDFVTLSVLNARGQNVITLLDDFQAAGAHGLTWQGKDFRGRTVSSGVYFASLKTGSTIETRKLLLLQ